MSRSPADEWRHRLGDLHTWKKGGQRAVHKPLLTLMLIARAEAGLPGEVRFAEIEEDLAKYLREFGPSRKSYHPEFPFWHLQTDGFWRLRDAGALQKKTGGNSPSRATLLKTDASGSVNPGLWSALAKDALLREDLTSRLLNDFWPLSQHAAIRLALALPDGPRASAVTKLGSRRDPRFRAEVLTAYEKRCAICGYDGRLADNLLGVEAAHVRWRAYEGPDTVSNGMALCSFHHVAFDAGAVSLADDLRILVSVEVSGQTGVKEWLHRFSGEPLRQPQPGFPMPDQRFVGWHRREVFKGPESQRGSGSTMSRFSIAADGEGGGS